MNIIINARKALLFHHEEPLIKKKKKKKKNGGGYFDAPLGCHDCAEVCELAGTFILMKPVLLCKNRTMLYYIEMMVWKYSEICHDPILKKRKH